MKNYKTPSTLILLMLLVGITGCIGNEADPSTDAGEASISALENKSPPTLGLKLIATGLTAPVQYISSDDGRMFAVDQTGMVEVFDEDGRMQEGPFMDLRDRMVDLSPGYDERGLLGMAFHPDFVENGRVFVFYSAPLRSGAPEGYSCTNRLSLFTVSEDDPDAVDMSRERVIFQIDKPQMNHNGGAITFGPDGYLYLPLGDGGGANDQGPGHSEGGNAQDTSSFYGKILRIDVDSAADGYAIPPDNPYLTDSAYLPEIWILGLRNPYGISFDSHGRLFVADAGQNLWEEVDLVEKGGNYGWNIREGTHCFDPESPNDSPASCPEVGAKGEPLIDPIIEYDHDNHTVVVGGYLYEGQDLTDLVGSYLFADWSSNFDQGDGRLYLARPEASDEGLWKAEEITIAGRPDGRIGEFIRAFGRDGEGEIYLLTSEVMGPSGDSGKIYKLVRAEDQAPT